MEKANHDLAFTFRPVFQIGEIQAALWVIPPMTVSILIPDSTAPICGNDAFAVFLPQSGFDVPIAHERIGSVDPLLFTMKPKQCSDGNVGIVNSWGDGSFKTVAKIEFDLTISGEQAADDCRLLRESQERWQDGG